MNILSKILSIKIEYEDTTKDTEEDTKILSKKKKQIGKKFAHQNIVVESC